MKKWDMVYTGSMILGLAACFEHSLWLALVVWGFTLTRYFNELFSLKATLKFAGYALGIAFCTARIQAPGMWMLWTWLMTGFILGLYEQATGRSFFTEDEDWDEEDEDTEYSNSDI